MNILSEGFYNDKIPHHEIQRKGDIECYDKFMEHYPTYPKIWWHNLILSLKKAKECFKNV